MTIDENIHELVRQPKRLLEKFMLQPKKSWGQNFLVDQRALETFSQAAWSPQRPLVEIGAGLGALTAYLARAGLPLHAVERDRDLIPILKELLATYPHVQIVEDNALTVARVDLVKHDLPRTIVGNLPYQLTAPLLMRVLQNGPMFARAVFMVQQEVAARLLAAPGDPERGSLSVWAELTAHITRLASLSPASFYPPPRVHSTIILIEPHSQALLDPAELSTLERLLRHGFGQRRKKLRNALRPLLKEQLENILAACEIAVDLRAELLDAAAWKKLTKATHQSLGA